MNSMRVPATLIFASVMIIILVSSSRTTYTFGTAPSAPVAACATAPIAEPEARRTCPWPRRTRHPLAHDDWAKNSWRQDAAADFAGPEQSRPELSRADASPPRAELPPE
jgi:hypothetical protein